MLFSVTTPIYFLLDVSLYTMQLGKTMSAFEMTEQGLWKVFTDCFANEIFINYIRTGINTFYVVCLVVEYELIDIT